MSNRVHQFFVHNSLNLKASRLLFQWLTWNRLKTVFLNTRKQTFLCSKRDFRIFLWMYEWVKSWEKWHFSKLEKENLPFICVRFSQPDTTILILHTTPSSRLSRFSRFKSQSTSGYFAVFVRLTFDNRFATTKHNYIKQLILKVHINFEVTSICKNLSVNPFTVLKIHEITIYTLSTLYFRNLVCGRIYALWPQNEIFMPAVTVVSHIYFMLHFTN